MNSNIMEYILTFLTFLAADVLVVAAMIGISKIKSWRRRRLVDRRIVAQAKALGTWDKYPIVLGGRALEIKAWERFKIKREPGEPDAHLRRRCMNAADNEYAAAMIRYTQVNRQYRRNRQ